MTPTAAHIYRTFMREGYYKSPQPMPQDEYLALLDEFARPFDSMTIRLGIRHPRLGNPAAIMAHSECNHFSDGVTWYCAEDGGASQQLYISPIAPIEAALSERDLELLSGARITLLAQRDPFTSVVRWERGRPVLMCPLGGCSLERDSEEGRDAVKRFYRLVRELAAEHRLRGEDIELHTGEFLMIDDRRFVHGRDALPEQCERVLVRSYLQMRDREYWLTRTVSDRPFGQTHPEPEAALA